ncbi:MAG: hypothetical protein ABI430_00215 [Candidatus Taylorbacteria bacterium]
MKATNPSNWDGRDPYELFPRVATYDADVSLEKPIEQVDEELREIGLDPQKLSSNAEAALKKALKK